MRNPKPPAWAGKTVAVLGSGPSLTAADVEAVRQAGWPTIVTNRTWELAPWADVLFAHDLQFWLAYGDRVEAEFPGRLFSIRSRGRKRIEVLDVDVRWFFGPANSGASAVSIAIAAGARRVVLLGIDCMVGADRAKHWHEPYRPGVDGGSNAASMPNWPGLFATVAWHARKHDVEVVNCSRATALTCFPCQPLEDVLKAEAIAVS